MTPNYFKIFSQQATIFTNFNSHKLQYNLFNKKNKWSGQKHLDVTASFQNIVGGVMKNAANKQRE